MTPLQRKSRKQHNQPGVPTMAAFTLLQWTTRKNLPLPLTGIGQEYYKRQLWLHNFCIHDTVQEKATMYLYGEHYAAKGPNDVISCLNHYVSTLPASVKELHIFADNCFSQTKTSTWSLSYSTWPTLSYVWFTSTIPFLDTVGCPVIVISVESKRKN